MDINGKTIKKGFALYETFGRTGKEETRVRKLIAVFDNEDSAMIAMREEADHHYDDPLEYNRNLIYGGKGIRHEHIDPKTHEPDEYHDYYIKEAALIL